MFAELFEWIEAHSTTVDLIKWASLVILAWISGAFAFLGRYRRRARLEIAEGASFVFWETPSDPNLRDPARVSFVINVSLVNASNEKVVLDHFELSFSAISFWRSNRQRLLRIALPSRPRKKIGMGTKFMGEWLTQRTDGVPIEVVNGILEAKESNGGYVLFVSYTYGSWNPKTKSNTVRIRMRAKLTSQQWLKRTAVLRVVSDPAFVEEFSPGFKEHVGHESTWNHEISSR